jgi:hypothetical protein
MSVELRQSRSAFSPGEQNSYRAVCTPAVASLVVAAFSFFALLDWVLGIIPAVAIALGLVALRRIQKAPLELTGERLALGGIMLASLFLAGGWMRLGWIAATEVPPGYQRVSFDDLQPSANAAADAIPSSARQLDGQRVFLRGYAYPGREQSGIKKFVLVRDNGQCCFGGNPKLTDMVEVTLENGLAMDYTTNMRRVAGTFHVAPTTGIDGLPHVVYHLDADYLQ